jgi:hypothetical protein
MAWVFTTSVSAKATLLKAEEWSIQGSEGSCQTRCGTLTRACRISTQFMGYGMGFHNFFSARAALVKAEEGGSKVAKGASDEVWYPDSWMWGFFLIKFMVYGIGSHILFFIQSHFGESRGGSIQGRKGSIRRGPIP